MISIRLINNTIRINCSKNQTIDAFRLKRLYRSGLKFMMQNGNLPVIVETERNVKLSEEAKKLFNRLDTKCNKLTLIIISG
jgi:hypothetical protein